MCLFTDEDLSHVQHFHKLFCIIFTPHYRSTAELENFQNLILMYASKRHSYTPPVYQCRNILAALDHNGHLDRTVITNKDGSVR